MIRALNINLHTGSFLTNQTFINSLEDDIETVEILINGKSLYCYTSPIGEANKNLQLRVNSTEIKVKE